MQTSHSCPLSLMPNTRDFRGTLVGSVDTSPFLTGVSERQTGQNMVSKAGCTDTSSDRHSLQNVCEQESSLGSVRASRQIAHCRFLVTMCSMLLMVFDGVVVVFDVVLCLIKKNKTNTRKTFTLVLQLIALIRIIKGMNCSLFHVILMHKIAEMCKISLDGLVLQSLHSILGYKYCI